MKLILQIILLALPVSVLAQMEIYMAEPNDMEADSLRMVYKTTSNDTVKMEVSRMLGFYFHEKNTDSAFYFQTQQLELARKLKFHLWEADALELCGFISRNMDRYPASLQYFQQALRILEDPKSEKNIWKPEVLSNSGTPSAARLTVKAFTHIDMGGLYGKTGNSKKELANFKETVRLAKDLNDTILLSLAYGSVGVGGAYMNQNNHDSALYYLKLEQKHTKKSGYYKYYGSNLNNIGLLYFKKGDFENSRTYYDEAIKTSLETGNSRILGSVYLDLAELLLHMNLPDSSLYFTRKALNISEITKLPRLSLLANKMLVKIFEQTGPIDSAYYYQKVAIESSDSIFSEEKIIHMQNLEFSEQMRINDLKEEHEKYQNKMKTRALIAGLVLILVVAIILYRNSRVRQRAYQLLHKQRNELQTTLSELKTTQNQLVHSEKMASLGELTAGIAHEIQNPLNFVNNFSDVSVDLVEELDEEMETGNTEEIKLISGDLKQNLKKIHHHGQRASSIVKGMLEHSRAGNNEKQPTDINAMADEYVRLAYHGMRAKDNSFQADFEADLDKNLREINVVGQDIARVVLNLLNNGFQAVHAKAQSIEDINYKPKVKISTRKTEKHIVIKVSDNGGGIPEEIQDKIFQPFFTTKPSGEGTGLGLSLSYDIITKGHGGSIKTASKEGEGTVVTVQLQLQ